MLPSLLPKEVVTEEGKEVGNQGRKEGRKEACPSQMSPPLAHSNHRLRSRYSTHQPFLSQEMKGLGWVLLLPRHVYSRFCILPLLPTPQNNGVNELTWHTTRWYFPAFGSPVGRALLVKFVERLAYNPTARASFPPSLPSFSATSFLPSFLPSFLRSFRPSFLPSSLPSLLHSFLLSFFLPFSPPFLMFFLLPVNVSWSLKMLFWSLFFF